MGLFDGFISFMVTPLTRSKREKDEKLFFSNISNRKRGKDFASNECGHD